MLVNFAPNYNFLILLQFHFSETFISSNQRFRIFRRFPQLARFANLTAFLGISGWFKRLNAFFQSALSQTALFSKWKIFLKVFMMCRKHGLILFWFKLRFGGAVVKLSWDAYRLLYCHVKNWKNFIFRSIPKWNVGRYCPKWNRTQAFKSQNRWQLSIIQNRTLISTIQNRPLVSKIQNRPLA